MSRNHTTRLAFAILAIAFFATPIAARILGITAEPFENRPFATAPKPSQGWDAFAQTTQYLTDRMPLRKQAIQANTHIWTNIFNTTPRYASRSATDHALPFGSPGRTREPPSGVGLQGQASASEGRGGWLFNDVELQYACDRTPPIEVVLDRWDRLMSVLEANGHATALFVVPEKASVYPEHLPDRYTNDHCALDEKRRLWRHLASHGPPRRVFELRSRLVELKRTAGDALFQRTDSHWSTQGALTLVEAILNQLGGEVRFQQADVIARGTRSYEGDLARVAGSTGTAVRLEYDIERAADATRVPGRTLIVCDSFAYKWVRLLKPYFTDLRYVSLYEKPAAIASAIRRSDTVILETEEVNLKTAVAEVGLVKQLTKLLTAEARPAPPRS